MSQPITLYSHKTGPNPWKVAILLEELSIPYHHKFLDMQTELKAKPFTDLNPNGRVPAISDPNTGISLWESGAIIEYLIATYDTAHKFSYTDSKNKWATVQWLYFQVSGQGPFQNFHAEKVPSASERYKKEIVRINTVLNSALQGKQYLVGDKCTYADLSFVTWAAMVPWIFGEDDKSVKEMEKDLPDYTAWMERLVKRPAVAKVLEEKTKAMSS